MLLPFILGWLHSRRVHTAQATVGGVEQEAAHEVGPFGPEALVLVSACIALLAGVRVPATSVAAVDAILTLAWIVGVANAFVLLDNRANVVAGVTAVTAAGFFALAIAAAQPSVAMGAAALLGCSLTCLAAKGRSPTTPVGLVGRLGAGVALAVMAVEVGTLVAAPVGVIVYLALLGLPLLGAVMVSGGRLSRGRRVWVDEPDHLRHRLSTRGLHSGPATIVVVGIQAALATLAVVLGRRIVPLWAGLAGALVVLLTVRVVCRQAQVYTDEPRQTRKWVGRAIVVTGAGLVVLAGPATVAMARASEPARTGADLARRALSATNDTQTVQAAADYKRAKVLFAQADERLHGPLTSFGRAIPGLSANLEASRTLVAIGERLASAGDRLTTVADARSLRVNGGSISVPELQRLTPVLADAARVLRVSKDQLAATDRPYLAPPLERAVRELSGRLSRDTETAERAAEGVRLLPSLLGANGPRRYFLAFQNNTELRGSGGLIGNWGELVAQDGQVRLGHFGRLGELIDAAHPTPVLHAPQEFLDRYRGFDVAGSWQQVNVSPDFPTTARVISDLYPQSGGHPVDGVIAVDPPGLAALLTLTGPVPVPQWPEPITAANVVDVTLRAAYERFPVQEDRVAFLDDLFRTVFEKVISVDLGNPAIIARSLGEATRSDHLSVYLNDVDGERLMSRVGADGAVPPVNGDSLMVVDQNLAANKVDFYLHRHVRYDVSLDPSSTPATLKAQIQVTLENQAPSSGLPNGVIGPYLPSLQPGENLTYLSLYSPFLGRAPTLDGKPLAMVSQPELGRLAHSATVSIPSRQSRTVDLAVSGRIALSPQGWYRLDLGHQPTIVPDEVEVNVAVPPGWRIAEVRGLDRHGSRRAGTGIRLDQGRTLFVRLERTGWSALWDRLLVR